MSNIGPPRIRIGFGSILLYYNNNKDPPKNSIGNFLGF